ncbi:ABC transporter ATP-binding protein [Sinorhizobium meliloti]|uniref:ABC transporter ATP-binding protein n=1 Tax=Rhizobium meliloti TaxID=382 RepID=UPI000FD945CD|nr:ABC transporter ATP-binding protein [Sinorhizobium meliloti]MDW9682370.1 ATP-binding cassette domain-containing protein [Sinorhizobium meliloti]MDW9695491.1 ATP-binding cassette domain-containing protein [Sinorhizobium meliloti]MDW9720357.1 ATP-binding cassette domain-containing protein [Sinorhizobium meliloti]MDW9757575.1 ATP-binding cassette domain-containing protein [Sinorhizobium meliloti]MDW9986507.1 ATP-binding cassette domain-containing protein [Sinorhizobium meliloti]
MASIEISDLHKTFAGIQVIQGLDLSIRDGEFISFLGPSGCGKSTLLFCIAGLEEIDRGSIQFDSTEVSDLPAGERNISLVFQDYALYPHMSVRENIAFPLRQQKIAPFVIAQQVSWAAGLLGIEHLLDRIPAQLSGGQRQRVAIGRAIVRNPAVLLMDEPLSNLDASLRVHTRTELRRLQKELGITVIFVTHDQEEAMVLSDRIAVVKDGVVQQFAAPMEVYAAPQNQFVAGFIGSPEMNFLPASVLGGRQEHVIGIRPHDLNLTTSASDKLQLSAELILVEHAGPYQFLDVSVSGMTVRATCTDATGLLLGQNLTLEVSRDKVHYFDAESGERVALSSPENVTRENPICSVAG